MISEGSRDTEDCSNDAENSALITEKTLTQKTVILNCNNSQYCIFDQINAALVNISNFFQILQ